MGLAFLVLYLHVHIGVYGTIFGVTLAFLANTTRPACWPTCAGTASRPRACTR
jgi:hypothetical protein